MKSFWEKKRIVNTSDDVWVMMMFEGDDEGKLLHSPQCPNNLNSQIIDQTQVGSCRKPYHI